MFCSLACSEKKDIKNNYPIELCEQLNNDSLQTLKGTININSKNDIVFDDSKNRNQWQKKTHLIPCSNDLKNYIMSAYDSYLYLKKFDEKFWVSVEGKYTTPNTLDNLPKFIFHFVALINEQEAITDSSQALRELVK